MTAEQKLSKIETLRTAQNYIKTLAGLMNDEQTDVSLDEHQDPHHDLQLEGGDSLDGHQEDLENNNIQQLGHVDKHQQINREISI